MRKRLAIPILVLLMLLAAGAWFEPTYTVRGWIRGELFFQHRSATWWRQRLISQDPTDQVDTPLRLRASGADAVPMLIELLRAPEARVRLKAVETLIMLGESAAPAARPLAAALKHPDPLVRR